MLSECIPRRLPLTIDLSSFIDTKLEVFTAILQTSILQVQTDVWVPDNFRFLDLFQVPAPSRCRINLPLLSFVFHYVLLVRGFRPPPCHQSQSCVSVARSSPAPCDIRLARPFQCHVCANMIDYVALSLLRSQLSVNAPGTIFILYDCARSTASRRLTVLMTYRSHSHPEVVFVCFVGVCSRFFG